MPLPAVRKISETIVDFGAPLVRQLDPDQPSEVVRSTFEIVILVWNAHVMAMPRWGQPRHLADLHGRLQDPQVAPQMVEAFKALSQRRAERFATVVSLTKSHFTGRSVPHSVTGKLGDAVSQ